MDGSSLDVRYVTAYAKLGIRLEKRPQLVANANHGLQIIVGCGKAGLASIDLAAARLANSVYFATPNRDPTLLAAAEGGAFAPNMRSYIEHYAPLATMPEDIRSYTSIVDRLLRVDYEAIDEHFKTTHLRDIVLVGVLCREIGGFDPTASVRARFRDAGMSAVLAKELTAFTLLHPEIGDGLEAGLREVRAAKHRGALTHA